MIPGWPLLSRMCALKDATLPNLERPVVVGEWTLAANLNNALAVHQIDPDATQADCDIAEFTRHTILAAGRSIASAPLSELREFCGLRMCPVGMFTECARCGGVGVVHGLRCTMCIAPPRTPLDLEGSFCDVRMNPELMALALFSVPGDGAVRVVAPGACSPIRLFGDGWVVAVMPKMGSPVPGCQSWGSSGPTSTRPRRPILGRMP